METAAIILQALSILVAALAFAWGVNAWRREHIGKRKIELSEKVLTLFYEARDLVDEIRSPFSNESEGQSRKRPAHETESEAKVKDRAYIVFERFESRKEKFNEINALKYQFMAVYGADKEKYFKDLNNIVSEIFRAAFLLGEVYWQNQGRKEMSPTEKEKHLEEMHEKEGILWRGFTDPDPIDEKLDEIVASIEKETKSSISLNFEFMERLGLIDVIKAILLRM